MEIITLGNCCKKSKEFYQNVMLAVAQCGLNIEVENIGDWKEIVNYGVMQTPALIIDKKVICSGKSMSVEQITNIIKEYL